LEHRLQGRRCSSGRGVFDISRTSNLLDKTVTPLNLFITTPSAVLLVTLVTGVALTIIQLRREEGFLTKTKGKKDERYMREVR
jgi:protein-S-isoprenylcysteine O-methyltransferase Ste14